MDDSVKKQKDPQDPVPPIGARNKETGVSSLYIEKSEPELNLSSDVESIGVEISEAKIPEQKDIGLVLSNENTKPNIASPKATFDMSKEELEKIVNDSRTEFNLKEQADGVYGGIPSIFGYAILMLKNFKKKLIRGRV